MIRSAWARARSWERRNREAVLIRALERTTQRSPVIVPEYSLRPRARWGWSAPVPDALAKLLTSREGESLETIEAALQLAGWCAGISSAPDPGAPNAPYWDNDFWGGLDAVIQVSELRRRDPALLIEIGSGYSTRFARRAITDFGLRTRIISIDPAPRASIENLCDEAMRSPAEAVPTEVFDRLGSGDILFIDGSHTALMNSDATVLMCEVLPRLAPGVLVGIHDVFLPWDYPPTWAHRWYGEQYLVAAFLLGGANGWRLRFPGWHLTHESALAGRFDPLWKQVETRFGRVCNSFWIERDG